MKSIRWNFSKGIRLLGRPQPGEARWIQDGLVEAGRIRPINKLDSGTLTDVTGTLTRSTDTVVSIWKRRAQIYYGGMIREWGPIMRAGLEVDCFTTGPFPAGNLLAGVAPGPSYPQKVIVGKTFPLGLPQPLLPPGSVANAYSIAFKTKWGARAPVDYQQGPGAATFTSTASYSKLGLETGKTWFYKIMLKVGTGFIETDLFSLTYDAEPLPAAPGPFQFWKNIFANYCRFLEIDWTPPTNLQGYGGILVFRGASANEKEMFLVEESDAAATFIMDWGVNMVLGADGNATPAANGQALSDYRTTALATSFTSAQYVSTYKFSQFGYTVEGAPSKVSNPIGVGTGVGLAFDPVNDGFWNQYGLTSIVLPGVILRGPCTLGESYAQTNLTLAGTFSNPSVQAYPANPAAAVFGISNGQVLADFPAGLGVSCSLGGVAKPAQRVDYLLTNGANGVAVVANKMLFMEKYNAPPSYADSPSFITTVADTVHNFHGGPITSLIFSSQTGSLLMTVPAFTPVGGLPLVSGEEILIYQKDATHTTPTNLSKGKVFRNNTNPLSAFVKTSFNVRWPTTANALAWCRNLGYLNVALTAAQQTALRGAMVLVTGSCFPTGRVFKAYPSNAGLYLSGDWTGYEYLNWGAGTAITLTIQYYPFNNGIVGRNLYRQFGGEFLLVKTLPLETLLYIDTTTAANLGSSITGLITCSDGGSALANPPPPDLIGATVHNNSFHGISRGDVRWSMPGWPDAFPARFVFSPDSPPVGLASFDGALIVGCRNGLWRLDGQNPDSYIPSKTLAEDGLMAAHSIQTTPFGLVYLGTRGICLFDGQRSHCLTEGRLAPWMLFPRWQTVSDGSTKANSIYSDNDRLGAAKTHLMDTLKGQGASWVAPFENASMLNALAQDNLFTVNKATTIQDYENLNSAYHRGRYYLYTRSWQAPEASGCWVIDFNAMGRPIYHLGLQPLDTCVDGDDFWILTNGDQ